jgi:hypothetical protein
MSGEQCLEFLKTNKPLVHAAAIVMIVDAFDKEIPMAAVDERLQETVVDVIRDRRRPKAKRKYEEAR